MLRVGLTGGLGSGKSTVAAMFARHGVHVLEADQIGRELMQPGRPVYQAILDHFRHYPDAPPMALPNGQLDRPALARYVFATNRLDELNRIVHPAVIAEQQRRMQTIFRQEPAAIVMVESALIFEADRGGTAPGQGRSFDKLILVTAPEDVRIARYVARVGGGRTLSSEEKLAFKEDARRRIRMQIPDAEKAPLCDFVLENSRQPEEMEATVLHILLALKKLSAERLDPNIP